MKKDYDAALGHLQVIAKNSGFDMSVVAAEERHLVGLIHISEPLTSVTQVLYKCACCSVRLVPFPIQN